MIKKRGSRMKFQGMVKSEAVLCGESFESFGAISIKQKQSIIISLALKMTSANKRHVVSALLAFVVFLTGGVEALAQSKGLSFQAVLKKNRRN